MELFYTPGTIALASLIALHEAEQTFTVRKIDFGTTEQQSAAYLKVNPKGRVPALVTPHGTLTETIALLNYIATLNPAAQLVPDEPFERALMDAFNSYLATTVHINHAHRMRGPRWARLEASFADMQSKVTENMTQSFQLIEDDYLRGPWVMGGQYTVADAYLFTIGRWLEGDGVDIAQFAKVSDHANRMAARPAVIAALAV